MPRVRFTLPEVKQPDTRPSSCPHCAGVAFHKHDRLQKRIKICISSALRGNLKRCVNRSDCVFL